jgi:hypothetical protein
MVDESLSRKDRRQRGIARAAKPAEMPQSEPGGGIPGPEAPIAGPRPDHVTDGVEVFIHRLESTASECRRAAAFWRDVIARALVRRRGEERKKAERN